MAAFIPYANAKGGFPVGLLIDAWYAHKTPRSSQTHLFLPLASHFFKQSCIVSSIRDFSLTTSPLVSGDRKSIFDAMEITKIRELSIFKLYAIFGYNIFGRWT